MQDDLKQKISQLMDNDLDRHEALNLLKKIRSSPDLTEKLIRYETISHALKTECFLLPDPEFSAKISQQIQQEPSYLLPGTRAFMRNRKMLATAASVAVVAVIAGLSTSHHPVEEVKTVSAFASPVMATANPGAAAHLNERYPVNKQINDYLQAHNSSVYINGQANFQPYTRVTAYSQK